MSSSNIQLPMVTTWDSKPSPSRKGSPSSTRSKSSTHRVTKRAGSHVDTTVPYNEHALHSHGGAGRRGKRVWKACERCRMKKTKCDGEFPCQRCNDDGLICTASVRKRPGYKQLPSGYAEVLENTQLVLVATIRKLYEMVRNGDQWLLGEPRCNDRGQAVIHHIAQKLACIRSNGDIDLPVQSVFPEDMGGMEYLAGLLREQQTSLEADDGSHKGGDCSSGSSTEAASPDYHSDFDQDMYHGAQRQDATLTRPVSPESMVTKSNQSGLSENSELEPYDVYPLSQLDDFAYESYATSSLDQFNKGPIETEQYGLGDTTTNQYGDDRQSSAQLNMLNTEFQLGLAQGTPAKESNNFSTSANDLPLWAYSTLRSADNAMLRQLLQLSNMGALGMEPEMLSRFIKPDMMSSPYPEMINRIESPMAYSGYTGF